MVLYHLAFNLLVSIGFIGFTDSVARAVARLMAVPVQSAATQRQQHMDPSALSTPTLAISNAAREALGEEESRRWTDIITFTLNMEQIGDIIERVIIDIEDKKIRPQRNFSDAGMAEIVELHERLVANLQLGMSVFVNGNVRDAQKLIEEKTRFRDLERAYATTHLARLSGQTTPSIETSSLHIDLISDLKRINSHICAVAYPILDSAGALAPSRLRESRLGTLEP